jgi:O-succinylbenzoate synthase
MTEARAKPEIDVRYCSTLAEYEECVRIEHLVWGEEISVPSGLFVVAHHTGGQTLGAFDPAATATAGAGGGARQNGRLHAGAHAREIHLRLLSPFETSFGKTASRCELRRIVLVEADVDGVSGWGESTAGENPFYSYETVETAWLILARLPLAHAEGQGIRLRVECRDMLAPVRGHNMAKAALEIALWDAEAKQKNMPLAKLLGGTLEEIPCGVSIGMQPTLPAFSRKLRKELPRATSASRSRSSRARISNRSALSASAFPRIRLMVDANSAYTLKDVPLLKALDAFYLIMIEQPLGWDDIFSHVQLQRQLDTPICLDECIHDVDHARAAIETKACRIINIKLGRVGGHTAARRMHDLCQAQIDPGVVRRHARIRHRTRAQYRDVVACRTLIFQVMCRLADAIGMKTLLSRKLKSRRRARFAFPPLQASATRRASTASNRSRNAAKSSNKELHERDRSATCWLPQTPEPSELLPGQLPRATSSSAASSECVSEWNCDRCCNAPRTILPRRATYYNARCGRIHPFCRHGTAVTSAFPRENSLYTFVLVFRK